MQFQTVQFESVAIAQQIQESVAPGMHVRVTAVAPDCVTVWYRGAVEYVVRNEDQAQLWREVLACLDALRLGVN